MIIAIDGPAGSGKSTVSKKVAAKLGFIFLDTGAMYRAITYGAHSSGVNLQDEKSVIAFANAAHVELSTSARGAQKVRLNGKDVTDEIRMPEITNMVKFVAKIPDVRHHLVEMQRRFAANNNIVAEGRDTTTVVFPNATLKVYLDGDQQERARRRFIELQEKGVAVTYEEILKDQEIRDKSDFERAVSPLKKAHDAFILDTTGMTIHDVVVAIVKEYKRRWFENNSPIYTFFRYPFWFPLALFNKFNVEGREHVPHEGGVLIASNHASFLDPIIIGVAVEDRQLSYMAKRSLFKMPVIGFLISLINVHPIDREKADASALQAGVRMVNEGKAVVIFPEGTRSDDGLVHDAKKFGAGFIAVRSRRPVVPAYVKGSFALLPKGKKIPKAVPVSVVFGKPIDMSDLTGDDREKYRTATMRIMDAIRELERKHKGSSSESAKS